MKLIRKLREKARALNAEIFALYLAYRHPQVSWVAKLIIAITIGYALSPIDLIPDFIPVFGFLDDLLIVPAGIALSIRLIPPAVLAECRAKAAAQFQAGKPHFRYAWLIVLFTWLLALALVYMMVSKFFRDPVT
ncbi:YkvA family protein [Adhaeribacter soli]|uniref:DUF1232 domain-containing protein n=1 Tax=Adhaeribacter soli TaxID=2607655 RepID=A0A5N1J3A9_9BACT|nr:YkvA family protein [Adhaeribacter soli]KAA9341006.1 DUF1232 domain-containing protein [Adhaeribacter soli]